MAIAWRVETIDPGSYRFFNFTGRLACEITIENGQAGEPVTLTGPVDFVIGTNSFDERLTAGDYTISWHSTEGGADRAESLDFTLPLAGSASALLETG